MPRKGQVQVLVWIDEEKKDRFKDMTATLNTTMTDVLMERIDEWMEENEERYRQVKAVLES